MTPSLLSTPYLACSVTEELYTSPTALWEVTESAQEEQVSRKLVSLWEKQKHPRKLCQLEAS